MRRSRRDEALSRRVTVVVVGAVVTVSLGLAPACGRSRATSAATTNPALGSSGAAIAWDGGGGAGEAFVVDAALRDAPAIDAGQAPVSLAPIPPDPLFTNLDVPGFPSPVVSVPNGATSARPVIVVLHGSGDRPDWNCDAWRHITGAHGFVLCPRGDYVPAESTRDDHRFTLRGGAWLARYVDAALDALAVRFGGYVDVERPVVTGFSLGATEISRLAQAQPSRFPRVAVLEGGHDAWPSPSARAFAERGGLRVLFGCGSAWCRPAARAAAERVEGAGVPARVVSANVGHTTDRPLQEAIMGELAWLLDGDDRWSK